MFSTLPMERMAVQRVSHRPISPFAIPSSLRSDAASWPDKSALAVVAVQSYCWVMLDWSKCAAVERITGKVSGAWLFKDTRVTVAALFENLEDGATMDNFLEWFPGVTR